jgi:hypothetical protein
MEHHVPRLPELMTNFWVTERHRGGLPARRHSAPNAEYALHFNCQLVFAEPRRTIYSGVAVGG